MTHRLNDEAETLWVGDDEAIRKLEMRPLAGRIVLEEGRPAETMRLAAAQPMRKPIVWN